MLTASGLERIATELDSLKSFKLAAGSIEFFWVDCPLRARVRLQMPIMVSSAIKSLVVIFSSLFACNSVLALSRTSARLLGGVGGARLVGDPVYFPGLAAIFGEGLLEVGRVGVDFRPIVSNEDGFAVDCVLGVKVAVSIFEFADLRRIGGAGFADGPVQAPLMVFGIVETHDQAFDVAGRTVGFEG